MDNFSKFELIAEKKIIASDVIFSLLNRSESSNWAKRTNHFAVNYIKNLTEIYGESWYSGLLPKEYFFSILLQKHGHIENEVDNNILLFPSDTSVSDAIVYYKNPHPTYPINCLTLINNLKENIKINGFTSDIILVVIDGKLKHVDGLHRIIALGILLEEGYEYTPVSTFICKAK